MDTDSYYLLASDNCEFCRYTSVALNLLALPYREIDSCADENQTVTENKCVALLTCEHLFEAESQAFHQFSKTRDACPIVVVATKQCQSLDTPLYQLPPRFDIYQLKKVVDLITQYHQSHDDHSEDFSHPAFEHLIGNSKKIRSLKTMIKQIAGCDSTVLIMGPSGTGKDVIASCIHSLSNRHTKPLVPINCGAIPAELIESELFGHEKGAFTGALSRRAGRFEIANNGTLFLDEIGDMPLHMQVKLLRVIQERKIERVGSCVSLDVDVRLIAATNKCLQEMVKAEKFREDLYYRLNVFPIYVPSLIEHREDIPLLVDYQLELIEKRLHHRVIFTDSAMDKICQYSWPGNIRELANFIERTVIMHPDAILDSHQVDLEYSHLGVNSQVETWLREGPFNIKDHIAAIEQQLIKTALNHSNGIITAAAEYLSLGRTTLIEKMKKYNLLSKPG